MPSGYYIQWAEFLLWDDSRSNDRQQRLQENLGLPLPFTPQWDIVHAKAKLIVPAHQFNA